MLISSTTSMRKTGKVSECSCIWSGLSTGLRLLERAFGKKLNGCISFKGETEKSRMEFHF